MIKLKELRKSSNLKQKDLAKALDVSRVTISRYENQQMEPDIKTLIKIAKYFSVSIDYLLGIKEKENIDDIKIKIKNYEKEKLAVIINEICNLLTGEK